MFYKDAAHTLTKFLSELETLIHELGQLIERNRGQAVDLDHIPANARPNASTIPVLHPQMFEINNFYQRRNNPYSPTLRGQEVRFHNLLSRDNSDRFACLVGPPGVGKTTLSKRLVKNQVYELSLRLNFASINYSNNLTLQELLLNKQFVKFGFSAMKCQKVFSWIIENQSEFLLVIDGLDQAQFNIVREPPDETHDARLSISTIIACLFKKIFLPNVRIIVTSRPHAVLDLHHSQRPGAVYQLEGLSDGDTDILLQFLSGDRYGQFSSNMKKLGPELKSLCACPLLLHMFVLSQLAPSETFGEAKTMTRIFATVLENLQLSKHVRTDLHEIHVKVARLAYKTFINNQILITWKQVTDEGLTKEEIQDLIITVPGREGIAFRVLDANKLLYFSHQMFHEFYCAWHICNNLSNEGCRQFLQSTRRNDNFIVVKKFFYGLAYDIDRNQGG